MPDFRHLARMTDNTGMLQFSRLQVPDPQSGYTLDDNARALMAALFMEEGRGLALKYARQLEKARRSDGSWSNFWLNGEYSPSFDSEDSVGRALLACALGSSSMWSEVRDLCKNIFVLNWPRVISFASPRGIAYALVAFSRLENAEWLPVSRNNIIILLGDRLLSHYKRFRTRQWFWFEDQFSYCNGVLPQALFTAYLATGKRKYLTAARESLDFLNSILFKKGYLNIIGNQGWYRQGQQIPLFDQQPVDAASIYFACLEAHTALGLSSYLQTARLAHLWFRGYNVHSLWLYDRESGGCYDALTAAGVNLNQGAESLLSLLLCDLQAETMTRNNVSKTWASSFSQ